MHRFSVLVAGCLLVASCSSDGERSAEPAPSVSVPTTAVQTSDPVEPSCDMLSAGELAELAGTPVGRPVPDLVGGLPVCKWPTGARSFVQVGSLSAPDWAQGLPELIRLLQDTGMAQGAEEARRLESILDLVESKDALSPTEACAMYSEMLELQGQPPGTSRSLSVVRPEGKPIGVSGQMCSAGRFTMVQVADSDGLAEPLPREAVFKALSTAHRRSLG